MESNDKIQFEISGNDYKNLKKFRKQHRNCPQGMTGEQFEYAFVPTGLGTMISVKCSCGQILYLGDFLDYESGEYDEKKSRVLTEQDHRNKQFEEVAIHILRMKDPGMFRRMFLTNQNYDLILNVVCGGIVPYVDERIAKCVLYMYSTGKHHEIIDNYKGLDEDGKIEKFFKHFEEKVREEIEKYDCDNITLLNMI